MRKIVLMLSDGMRPDALGGIPEYEAVKNKAYMTLNAHTVYPSVTLPAHLSLFLDVDPARHGTMTNTYMPQVRPVDGLFDVLHAAGLCTAMYYSWAQLRDISRPGSLDFSFLAAGDYAEYETASERINEAYFKYRELVPADFTFLYYGCPDEEGHAHGWMGPEYMEGVRHSWRCMAEVMERTPDTDFIILADHGGHDRTHGYNIPEDMTIPVMMIGPDFPAGDAGDVSILDIAPTVAALLGVKPARGWEGKNLLK